MFSLLFMAWNSNYIQKYIILVACFLVIPNDWRNIPRSFDKCCWLYVKILIIGTYLNAIEWGNVTQIEGIYNDNEMYRIFLTLDQCCASNEENLHRINRITSYNGPPITSCILNATFLNSNERSCLFVRRFLF